jgi:hypothetical protein
MLSSYGRAAQSNVDFARLIPAGVDLHPQAADLHAAELFLSHRFDLLGAGWVRVTYGMECAGFEGFRFESQPTVRESNLFQLLPVRAVERAMQLRAMISPDYKPIDWQLDFRSGFRWSERSWYRDVTYGAPGADIKMPWELSRLQHLPELATAYAATHDRRFLEEFRNQTIDWISANPPRFGVNWVSSMDVGIRIANMLIAFDLFRAVGAGFEREFITMLFDSTYDHARHIARNLEWSETHRANHYFGNIAGLLFAGAYLPAGAESDAWLAFGLQEITTETLRQFGSDGGHFEASTSYHRLCAETAAVCAAFVGALPAQRVRSLAPHRMRYGPGLRVSFAGEIASQQSASGRALSDEFYQRVARARLFTLDMTKPDGTVVQIGDNDSGRFVRLGGWNGAKTIGEARRRYAHLESFRDLPDGDPYIATTSLDHSHWVSWADALLGTRSASSPTAELCQSLARALVADNTVQTHIVKDIPEGPRRSRFAHPRDTPTHRIHAVHRAPGASLLDGAFHAAYKDFGVYVIRSSRLHLVIRCGDSLRDGSGAHAHEDHLSLELTIDGVTLSADPGTFVYTAAPEIRNRYRSTLVHACPSANAVEPSTAGPFSPPRVGTSECEHFDLASFVGVVEIDGGTVRRRVCVRDDTIEIADEYWLAEGRQPQAVDPFRPPVSIAYSPGYGVRVR